MENPRIGGPSVALWRRRPFLIAITLVGVVGVVFLMSYLFSPRHRYESA